MLTEEQNKALGKLLGRAFIQIRILGWGGKAEQAADLADALHNLPYDLFYQDFSWERLIGNIETYHQKYPPNERGEYFDFLALGEQIQTNTDLENVS